MSTPWTPEKMAEWHASKAERFADVTADGAAAAAAGDLPSAFAAHSAALALQSQMPPWLLDDPPGQVIDRPAPRLTRAQLDAACCGPQPRWPMWNPGSGEP